MNNTDTSEIMRTAGREYFFSVAEMTFAVVLPDGSGSVETLLPSFRTFAAEPCGKDDLLFTMDCRAGNASSWLEKCRKIGESDFDGGYAGMYKGTGYVFTLRLTGDDSIGTLRMSPGYSKAEASLPWRSCRAGDMLSSMLRIMFAQACLNRRAVSLHASCVVYGGRSVLFMGKSGTGKSTHSDMWRKAFGREVTLLNDDNPVVRLTDEGAVAYGSPWSGKRPCYKNAGFEVAAMVRLRQHAGNEYTPLEGLDAFMAIYPGCSVIQGDAVQKGLLMALLQKLIHSVNVALLQCRPDVDAANVCRNNIFNNNNL